MKNTWTDIEIQLATIAPEILENLHPGATMEEIEKLENLINVKLPLDFVEFYKIHNGQTFGSAGFIDCEEFLSIDRIIEEWTVWKDLLDQKNFEDEVHRPYQSTPDEGIKNDWWNALWIPITYDGSGNHYCLDLDPTAQGHYGQIIRMWHDDAERSLEATSFGEWIRVYKDKLKSGQLVYSDDYFGIIDKSELGED